ncbi:MAG: hypothetical protein J5843_00375 [Clostridia bacterium]|nr:hypothetical protein [Clostridia bacterium]
MFRLRIESKLTHGDLCAYWDDRTSAARYAGNDGDFDNVFVAKRKENRVRLIRKARNVIDPFATVFWGQLLPLQEGEGKKGSKSVLTGFFGKSILDYILLAILFGVDALIFIYNLVNHSLNTTVIAGCAALLILFLVLIIPTKSARERYTELLDDIARGGETPEETADDEQP